jgi:type I restriction enzyme, R subunit
VVEAKKEGSTLTGFEGQTAKYGEGLPSHVPAPRRPLPFLYQSTGVETRVTNLLEPDARSRNVFAFHQPETLAEWLEQEVQHPGSTLRAELRQMPPLIEEGLRPAQIKAINNLEVSLAQHRPRALIQMASGGGKTYTACNVAYRLIKHAGAKRILFLVDRGNLGRQTLKEFQAFITPEENRPFTELYNVQLMQSNKLDDVSKVCITTIQRLYSMLRGEEQLDPALEEESAFTMAGLQREPVPVGYNPRLPIETFDFIITDECHRSIYNLWRQVLEYFDGFLIGLTATPSKQTFGFFNQNLVMEYNHEQAVADRVNVDFDVYRIRTLISEHGSAINAGFTVDKRDRQTRKKRWETLDDEVTYAASQLDRDIVAPDQIRTIVRTFRDRLFTEIFPDRTEVPKTLIFAKDDSHADDIVQIVREEFGKGNDFAQKITYRTGTARKVTKVATADGGEIEQVEWVNSGIKAEDLLSSFRNSYNPRIAVTVDMIATGTDIRPLEIVFFMRQVRSRLLFEQMKGRGARVVTETELQAVTPDALSKTHFVLVDAIGLSEEEMSDTHPLERKKNVSFEKLLESVAFGSRDPDILSSIASRLARLDNQLTKEDRELLTEVSGGRPLTDITRSIVEALDPDVQVETARKETGAAEPTETQVKQVADRLLADAAKPLAANPALRQKIIDVKKSYEQIIDTISADTLIFAGVDDAAKQKAKSLVESFEKFIAENRDEITALQVLYSKPYKQRLTFKQIKELAEALGRPHDGLRGITPDLLWHAYETLDRTKVKGSGGRVLTDIVSLVRFAIREQPELHPYQVDVNSRFERWMASQSARNFTTEQVQWLESIRDHIATSLTLEVDDFDFAPFVQRGGLGKAYQVFGDDLLPLVNELNEVLVA